MKTLKSRNQRRPPGPGVFRPKYYNKLSTTLQQLNPCIGVSLNLHERNKKCTIFHGNCTSCCHHQAFSITSNAKSPQNEDWISENHYKKYTETDSRPVSPSIFRYRVKHASRKKGNASRRCLTPEPEGQICSSNSRRVLILDLRKLKSFDVLTRQDSLTSTTTLSAADGDEEFRVTRSTPPLRPLTRKKKLVQSNRQQLPAANERPSSPKNPEETLYPPLHSSVLSLLNQGQNSATHGNGTAEEGSGTKQKQKLRRQGRRRKGESQEKGDDEKNDEGGDNGKQNAAASGNLDVNKMAAQNVSNQVEDNAKDIAIGDADETPSPPSSTLYQILEDRLSKKRWYLREADLNSEIGELEKALGRTEKTLQEMNLNDDLSLLLISQEPKKRIYIK